MELSVQRRCPSLQLRDGRTIRFPAVMGILNITPDSFSDGGLYLDPERAVEHALELEAQGADIIDIGGESTRPNGAREVPLADELKRVTPVLEGLRGRLRAPLSIDTRKAVVARAALDLGAVIINDVSALTSDSAMASLAAERECAVVLMHMRGGPADHMKFAHYQDVVGEVGAYLSERARIAIEAGIAPSRIILDPGLGFSKQPRHSLRLLGALPRLCALGYPILIGASRKGFVRTTAGASPAAIEFGSAAADAMAVLSGAAIVRAHNVEAAVAAVKIAASIKLGDGG